MDHGTFKAESHPQPQVNTTAPEMPQKPEIPQPQVTISNGPSYSVNSGVFQQETHNGNGPEAPKPEIPQPQVTISNGPPYSVNSGVFRQETHNGNVPEAPKPEIPKNNEAPQGDKNGRNEGSGKKK